MTAIFQLPILPCPQILKNNRLFISREECYHLENNQNFTNLYETNYQQFTIVSKLY